MCQGFIISTIDYNRVNAEKAKKQNKIALQREMGLKEDENVMLVGVVSRLTWQKALYGSFL